MSHNGLLGSMHTFDITRTDEVTNTWRSIAAKTKSEATATAKVDPREQHMRRSNPPSLRTSRDLVDLLGLSPDRPSPPNFDSQGSLTPAGKQQAKQAAMTMSHNSPVRQDTTPTHTHNESAENRWEAYGAAPGDFATKPAAASSQPKIESPRASRASVANTEQPLLALFRAELAKLTHAKPSEDKAQRPAPMRYVEPKIEEVTEKSQPANGNLEPQAAVAAPTPCTVQDAGPQHQSTQTQLASNPAAGELIGSSLKSLFEGFGLLASGVLAMNSEVRQQVVEAQQDFPNGLEKALRASTTAIDSFRENMSTSKNEAATPQETISIRDTGEDPESSIESSALSASTIIRLKDEEKLPWLDVVRIHNTETGRTDTVEELLKRHKRLARTISLLSQNVPNTLRSWLHAQPIEAGLQDKRGCLLWQSGERETSLHGFRCIERCTESDCPVREAVARAYNRMSAPNTSANPLAKEHQMRLSDSRSLSVEYVDAPETPKNKSSWPAWLTDSSVDKPLPVWAQPSKSSLPKDWKPATSSTQAGGAASDHVLRHRKSWHPSSSSRPEQDTRSFNFSPAAVMEKYPPVSSFEDEPRQAHREKSVKFADPWVEKRFAQREWAMKKPRNEFEASSNVWVTQHDQKRPVTCPTAASPATARSTRAEEMSTPESKREMDLYGPPSPPAQREEKSSVPLKSRWDETPLSAAIRRASSMALRRGYRDDIEQPADLTEARASIDERERRPYSCAAPAAPRSATPPPPLANTTSADFSGATNGPRAVFLERARAGVKPMPSMPELSRPRPDQPPQSGRPSNRQSDRASNPAPTASNTPPRNESTTRAANIKHCITRLTEMGFRHGESETVAESVAGDLESAIDVLEEDRRASEEFVRRDDFRGDRRDRSRDRTTERGRSAREQERRDKEAARDKEMAKVKKRATAAATWGPEDFFGAAEEFLGAVAGAATGVASGIGAGSTSRAGEGRGSGMGRTGSMPGAFPGSGFMGRMPAYGGREGANRERRERERRGW